MRRIFFASALLFVANGGICAATAVTRMQHANDTNAILMAELQQHPQFVAAVTTSACDENDLKHDAMGLLNAHFDVELGAVAPGDTKHVGFQYLVRMCKYHAKWMACVWAADRVLACMHVENSGCVVCCPSDRARRL
jgi:hypothetical protein